jgi:hypothetical protein
LPTPLGATSQAVTRVGEVGELAERFVVDIDEARQLSERLAAIARAIGSVPPGPRPHGPLGTGVLERAWSDFERGFARARQNLVLSVRNSSSGFAAVASGTTRNDQQQAQQASQEIGTA